MTTDDGPDETSQSDSNRPNSGETNSGELHSGELDSDRPDSTPRDASGARDEPQGARRPSYVALATAPLTKRVAVFAAAAYGAVAVGLGAMLVALKLVGRPAVTAPEANQRLSDAARATEFVNQSAQLAVYLLPVLAAALSALLGFYAARELDARGRALYAASAVAAFAGTLVLVAVGTGLASLAFGVAFSGGDRVVTKPGRVAAANVARNAAAVGVGAAVVATFTAYAHRRFA